MDRHHVSSFVYTLGTVYKMAGKMLKLVFQQSMDLLGFLAWEQLGGSQVPSNVISQLRSKMMSWPAGGATGTTLGLVSGYRKPVLTKQQRLQQEFEAPWLRLLRSVSVDVEDLAGAEAALEFLLQRLEKLEADARLSEQQSEEKQDAVNAAGQSCSQFPVCSLPVWSAESIAVPEMLSHWRLASLRQKWVALLVYLIQSHALQKPEEMQHSSSGISCSRTLKHGGQIKRTS